MAVPQITPAHRADQPALELRTVAWRARVWPKQHFTLVLLSDLPAADDATLSAVASSVAAQLDQADWLVFLHAISDERIDILTFDYQRHTRTFSRPRRSRLSAAELHAIIESEPPMDDTLDPAAFQALATAEKQRYLARLSNAALAAHITAHARAVTTAARVATTSLRPRTLTESYAQMGWIGREQVNAIIALLDAAPAPTS